MKHIKTLTTILLLAIFAFTSCSKEELINNKQSIEIKMDEGYELIWNKDLNGYVMVSNKTSKRNDPEDVYITYLNQDNPLCQYVAYCPDSGCYADPVDIDCCDVPGINGYEVYDEQIEWFVYEPCE